MVVGAALSGSFVIFLAPLLTIAAVRNCSEILSPFTQSEIRTLKSKSQMNGLKRLQDAFAIHFCPKS